MNTFSDNFEEKMSNLEMEVDDPEETEDSNAEERPHFQLGEENPNGTEEKSAEPNANIAIDEDEAEKAPDDAMSAGNGNDSKVPEIVAEAEPDTISLAPSEGTESSSKMKVKTPSRATLATEVIHIPTQPADVVEYEWPQKSGDRFFVQEQISELLGISSFKRKYPEMFRRTIEPKERDYLLKDLKMKNNLGHHLTALQSVDVHELMASEYPDIYAAYQKACNERIKQAMIEKQKELDAIKADAKKMAELRQKAIRSAFEFNSDLQAVRRSERVEYWDLNTNIIHSQTSKWLRISKEYTKPSKYPVFCLPGQYTEYYKKFVNKSAFIHKIRFDPAELRKMPLNTVLDGHLELFPPKKENSPPPITVTDEEVAAAAAAKMKSEETNSPSKEPKMEQQEVSAPPTPSTSSGAVVTAKRAVKQEPVAPRSPGGPPPSKSRKLSASTAKKTSAASKLPSTSSIKAMASSSKTTTNSLHGTSQEQLATCMVCQLSSDSNPHSEALLIRCSACQQQMHSSCIDMPPSMVTVIRQYDWLCIDCKRCCVCEKPDQEAAMMCCDQCDRGYHTFCIGLDQPPNGTWHCPECKDHLRIQKMMRQYDWLWSPTGYQGQPNTIPSEPNNLKPAKMKMGDGGNKQIQAKRKRGRPRKNPQN